MAKILLVEDDKSLREIYGVRLLAEGYDIVSAGDGEEALAMAIKERPQLIVSDVMMPKISGFDMLDILRSTSETKDIKVIMMTALSSEDQRQRGEQLGADRYLVKSQVGIEDVVRTVHEVLADMPTPGSAQNAFGSAVPRSAPTAVAQPAPAPVAQPAAAPAPAPAQPASQPTAPATPGPVSDPFGSTQVVQPTAPVTTPAPQPTVASPSPAPAAQPVATPAPAPVPTQPAPQPAAPAASSLPQPTAPFSTARPAGLADRIIQPLERPEETGEPLASLIDKELGESTSMPAPAAPPVPPAPAPMPQPDSSTPAAPPSPAAGPEVGFEETPRA